MSLQNAKLPSLKDKIEAQAKTTSVSIADELENLEEELEEPRKQGKKGKKKAGN